MRNTPYPGHSFLNDSRGFPGYVFKCFDQELPEFADGGDIYLFAGGVGMADGRPARDHIPVGIFSAKDAAFQTCVDSPYN